MKYKEICINCANLELESCNKDRIVKCRYCNSGRHKKRDLQKLEYNFPYIRWKHLLQLIHKYSIIPKESIILKIGITESNSFLRAGNNTRSDDFDEKYKIPSGYQKMNKEKIDDKPLCGRNRNLLIIPPYRLSGSSKFNYNYSDHKLSYEDIKALKKLEDDSFKILVNIINISSYDNNINDQSLETIFKPKPSFSMHIRDIPLEIDEKLDQLPEPILYEFTDNLIDRLHEYIRQNENLHAYHYFVEEIRDDWLLKWRFI